MNRQVVYIALAGISLLQYQTIFGYPDPITPQYGVFWGIIQDPRIYIIHVIIQNQADPKDLPHSIHSSDLLTVSPPAFVPFSWSSHLSLTLRRIPPFAPRPQIFSS